MGSSQTDAVQSGGNYALSATGSFNVYGGGAALYTLLFGGVNGGFSTGTVTGWKTVALGSVSPTLEFDSDDENILRPTDVKSETEPQFTIVLSRLKPGRNMGTGKATPYAVGIDKLSVKRVMSYAGKLDETHEV